MDVWKAQSIQFAWFLTTTDGVRVDTLFEALLGQEPDSVQRNKVPGPANPFLGVASGALGGAQAHLQLQPGRLDLLVLANDPDESDDFPLINTGAILERLYSALSSSEAMLPSAIRLAVVCNLLEPAESAEESREVISQLISLDPALSDYSDLMLQLNRRKTLAGDVVINRLLRWNSISLQSYVMNVPGQQGLVVPLAQERHASALMLDMSVVE